MRHKILQTEQKALEINLEPSIYGTFAEIGAGQEVARNFFQVGAAAGTIAKTMSAYDKTFSDEIYGEEPSGRYVCESRLLKMLDHEYDLVEERLADKRPDCKFFVFADTIAAINYQRTIKGNGWLGVRFRLGYNAKPNDLIIHVKMLDNDNKLQQEAIGKLGVNLIYACYFYHDDPERMVLSLKDGLEGRIAIDFIRLDGPNFEHVDNRLLTLFLVKQGHTEVAMFNKEGRCIHASAFLYKKSLMVVRGHYQPPTLVTEDVLNKSFAQFLEEERVDRDKAEMVVELTLENLKSSGEIDYDDFLARAELIAALGFKTIISNCINHQTLINYLGAQKVQNLGLVIGIWELRHLINEKYYLNRDGRLLVAFGELFTRNIKVYSYPALDQETGDLMTVENMPIPKEIDFLYRYLLQGKQIIPIRKYNEDLLHIFPNKVYESIVKGTGYWEDKVPKKLAAIIKEKGLFGYQNKEKVV